MYIIADALFGPECNYVHLCTIKTPEMQKPPYSAKWTGSPVLTVPELYKIYSINRTLNLFATFGGFKGRVLILTLSLIVLTFLNLTQLHKGQKMRPHFAQQPVYTLPCPLEAYQKPLKYGYHHITDTQWWSQQCPLRGAPLYIYIYMYIYIVNNSFTYKVSSLLYSSLSCHRLP